MSDRFDSYWKTVNAQVTADRDRTEACLEQAAQACGFRRHDGAWLRAGWFLWLPTIQEWRIAISESPAGAAFSVRFGLRFGWLYYVMLLAGFAAAIVAAVVTGEQFGRHPVLDAALITAMAVLYAAPVVHGLTARWQAGRLESQLWRAVAPLGPWQSSQIVIRSLNRAYGRDRVVENRDLASPYRLSERA